MPAIIAAMDADPKITPFHTHVMVASLIIAMDATFQRRLVLPKRHQPLIMGMITDCMK